MCVFTAMITFIITVDYDLVDIDVLGWEWLWLSGRASYPKVNVLGQNTEPQTAPDVLVGTLHGSHRHQCMNYYNSLWRKVSA